MSAADASEPDLPRARRMVAIFWIFTVLYVALIVAILVTRGVFGLIFVVVLFWSWIFRGWPDTKPHFKVLREDREARRSQNQQAEPEVAK
ncbi:hypothetical protein [Arthrobacter sp. UYCo732]|uniref:hypothetical protein n=1 Tax=Arthrobacter sp. UYCo732 TaxID=3156336 RepID=UPI003398564E